VLRGSNQNLYIYRCRIIIQKCEQKRKKEREIEIIKKVSQFDWAELGRGEEG